MSGHKQKPVDVRDDKKRDAAAPHYSTPSVAARIWVNAATEVGRLIEMLPPIDRSDASKLLPLLWSSDPEEVTAAQDALYELIDSPPGRLMKL